MLEGEAAGLIEVDITKIIDFLTRVKHYDQPLTGIYIKRKQKYIEPIWQLSPTGCFFYHVYNKKGKCVDKGTIACIAKYWIDPKERNGSRIFNMLMRGVK